MLPADHSEKTNTTMKMKYILLFAAAMFTFGAPMADAAPKKSKKAKTKAVVTDEFDVFSPSEEEEDRASRKAAKEKAADEAVEERALSGAERREENKQAREDSKYYIENQKKTLKILRSVRNEKSAAKAVKPLEQIYGEVFEASASDGALTALGTVKIMEEDEEKLPVHQSLRSVAAALNQAINKEIARIAKLNIQHKKFNGAMQNMIDSQR